MAQKFIPDKLSDLLDKVTDFSAGRDKTRENKDGEERAKPLFGSVATTSSGTSGVPGAQGEFGLVDGKLMPGVKVKAGTAHGGLGKFEDDDEDKQFGFSAGATSAELELKTKKLKELTGQTVSGEVKGPSVDAHAHANSDGFSIGASAGLVDGGVTVGNPEKNFLRLGGGAGVGGGVRAGWGKNEDGKRQITFGADILDGSFDVGLTGTPKWVSKAGEKAAEGGEKALELGKKGGKEALKLGKKGGKQLLKLGGKMMNKLTGKDADTDDEEEKDG